MKTSKGIFAGLGDAEPFLFGRAGPPAIWGAPSAAQLGADECCYDELRGLGADGSEVALRLPWWMWAAGLGAAAYWLKRKK